jgi:hypothetical protein
LERGICTYLLAILLSAAIDFVFALQIDSKPSEMKADRYLQVLELGDPVRIAYFENAGFIRRIFLSKAKTFQARQRPFCEEVSTDQKCSNWFS